MFFSSSYLRSLQIYPIARIKTFCFIRRAVSSARGSKRALRGCYYASPFLRFLTILVYVCPCSSSRLFAPFIQPEVVVSNTLGCKNEWKPSKESYSHHKVVVNGPSLWVSFPVEVAGHNIWQGPSKLLMVMAIKFWPPWQGPSKLPWAAGNVREVNLDCSQLSISQDGVIVLYYL